MQGTFQLGRVFGIPIRIHFSWVFIFLLVAWSLASSYLPGNYPGWSRAAYWGVGVVASALLFVSVLIHEGAHSLMALSKGKKVSAITLFFLGGASEIPDEADNASEEFWIAVVGPLTSFALAGIFWALDTSTQSGNQHINAVFKYLWFINIALGVFNLMPAFPLDGGRVLRALVWKSTGSLTRANSVASTVGVLIGYGLIGVGIYFVFSGGFIQGLWMVFIGWFIQSSASSYARQQTLSRTLTGRLVRDAMVTDVPVITPDMSVQRLIDERLTAEFQRAYVVMYGETFQGLVSISAIKSLPPESRAATPVTAVMKRANEVVTATPDEPLESALQKMVTNDIHQLVVLSDGKAVGLLTRGDVLRVVEITEVVAPRGRG
ncbi:MAG: CBS domain-containing protein [SAR202 cluster bacterium]|nr:CBS domain-containing protein [SAR202 cluster bacterium]